MSRKTTTIMNMLSHSWTCSHSWSCPHSSLCTTSRIAIYSNAMQLNTLLYSSSLSFITAFPLSDPLSEQSSLWIILPLPSEQSSLWIIVLSYPFSPFLFLLGWILSAISCPQRNLMYSAQSSLHHLPFHSAHHCHVKFTWTLHLITRTVLWADTG